MTDAVKDERERLRKTLSGMLMKIPPQLGSSSWNAAVAFKEWGKSASKLVANANVKSSALRSSINTYETFCTGEKK